MSEHPPEGPSPGDEGAGRDFVSAARAAAAGALREGEAGDGRELHIPGAGTIGMWLLIASLSVLFAASMVAVLVIRSQAAHWPPPGAPLLPRSLWASTGVILLASLTIQLALNAVRRDRESSLVHYLVATLVIGVIFLVMQSLNWYEYYVAVRKVSPLEGPYMAMFFVLTGLHAAHVVGGLIPLVLVIRNARLGRYSRNFHPGVRYVTVYWHFLDVIWIVLFGVIYF